MPCPPSFVKDAIKGKQAQPAWLGTPFQSNLPGSRGTCSASPSFVKDAIQRQAGWKPAYPGLGHCARKAICLEAETFVPCLSFLFVRTQFKGKQAGSLRTRVRTLVLQAICLEAGPPHAPASFLRSGRNSRQAGWKPAYPGYRILSRDFRPLIAPAIIRFTAARESPPSSCSGIVAKPIADAFG